MSAFGDWLSKVAAAGTDYVEPLPPLAPEEKVEIPVVHGIADLTQTAAKPRPLVTNSEVHAGCERARAILDESGYGSWVSDAQIEHLVTLVLIDAAKIRSK